jgi:hypothetical protein
MHCKDANAPWGFAEWFIARFLSNAPPGRLVPAAGFFDLR